MFTSESDTSYARTKFPVQSKSKGFTNERTVWKGRNCSRSQIHIKIGTQMTSFVHNINPARNMTFYIKSFIFVNELHGDKPKHMC